MVARPECKKEGGKPYGFVTVLHFYRYVFLSCANDNNDDIIIISSHTNTPPQKTVSEGDFFGECAVLCVMYRLCSFLNIFMSLFFELLLVKSTKKCTTCNS